MREVLDVHQGVEGMNNYLAVTDRFTGWIELYKMDGKAMNMIKTRNLFSQIWGPIGNFN